MTLPLFVALDILVTLCVYEFVMLFWCSFISCYEKYWCISFFIFFYGWDHFRTVRFFSSAKIFYDLACSQSFVGDNDNKDTYGKKYIPKISTYQNDIPQYPKRYNYIFDDQTNNALVFLFSFLFIQRKLMI